MLIARPFVRRLPRSLVRRPYPGSDPGGPRTLIAGHAHVHDRSRTGIMRSPKEAFGSVDAPRAGGPMPSADEIRDAQRTTWAGLSAAWAKWDAVIMDQL